MRILSKKSREKEVMDVSSHTTLHCLPLPVSEF